MSSAIAEAGGEALPRWTPRETVLSIYAAILGLMIVGIGILTAYTFSLGPLVGPGVESSFGYAVALMFLMGALAVHTAEATYRLWPLGRRFLPQPPPAITARMIASFLKVLVVVAAGAALAYLVAGFLV